MMHTTTPLSSSEPVRSLCRELVKDAEPQFIRVTPVQGARTEDCYHVIDQQVKQHGGTICYGWQIWECPGVMIEAEFHAVWRDDNGELHDLTPKSLPVDRILFLPDPTRIYEGRQINNIRRAISSSSEVREFIMAADAEYEIMNRGERAHQHGPISLNDSEALEMVDIQRRKLQAYEMIVSRHPEPGRNDPCPCGSGKKFKKCHGR